LRIKYSILLGGFSIVSDKDFFEGLSEDSQKKYKEDTINRYGKKSFKKANNSLKKMTHKEWERYQSNLNNLIQQIANCMEDNAYNSKKIQKLIDKHFKLVGTLSPTTKESYIELANLYSEHNDFIAFFDNYRIGLSKFLSKAMIYFANGEFKG
jgi:TipAS antibiotic-recognition protein